MQTRAKLVLSILSFFSVATSAHAAKYPPPFDVRRVSDMVGYLDMAKGLCNVSLVGDNLGLTNAHCLYTEAECKGTVGHFFKDGKPSGSYRCGRIVATGAKPDAKLKFDIYDDFTIIEFQGEPSLEIGSLPIAKASGLSVEPMQIAWRVKVDPPTATNDRARQNYVSCHTGLDPKEKGVIKMAGSFEGEACQTFRGNSGGPMFNAKGEIIGVVAVVTQKGVAVPLHNDMPVDAIFGPTIDGIISQTGTILHSAIERGR